MLDICQVYYLSHSLQPNILTKFIILFLDYRSIVTSVHNARSQPVRTHSDKMREGSNLQSRKCREEDEHSKFKSGTVKPKRNVLNVVKNLSIKVFFSIY